MKNKVSTTALASLLLIDVAVAQGEDGRSAVSLEEIVVTARRQTESLQDTPVAVSALNASSLEKYGINRVQDLQFTVPNLQISSPYGDSQPNFTLRGIGPANQFQINTASPIGLYIDEVYQAFRPTQGLQMFDLERVEVVKGPQGTLFGRNTTAGAISLFTKQPELDGNANGYILGEYGNFNRYKFEGASDLTFAEDKLGLRVAFSHRYGDGQIKNAGQGDDFASVDSTAARAILRYLPTDRVDMSMSVTYSEDDPIPTPVYQVGLLDAEGRDAYGYSRFVEGLDTFEAESDDTKEFFAKTTAATFRLIVDLDQFVLTSVTSYSESKQRQRTDCDGTPNPVCYFGANVDADEFSQDIRVNYTGDAITWVAGLYYGEDTMDGDDNTSGFFINPDGTGGTNFRYDFHQKRSSYAAYFEGNYSLTEKLNLSLGGRQTWDSNELSDYQNFLLDSRGGQPIAITVPFSPVLDTSLRVPSQEEDESYFSWRAILDYHFADDVMGYVTYSKGFRSGNFNAQAFASADELVYIGPEKADHYELGMKSSFFDNRLNVNTALFWVDYQNQQILDTVGVNNTLVGLKGTIKGLEVETQAAVTETLTVTANLGVLESEYDEGQVSAGPVDGQDFPFAPDMTFQLGFDWDALVTDSGVLIVSANISYTGEYTYLPSGSQGLAPNSRFKDGADDYWLVNARLSYQSGDFEVSLWGKNLTEEEYFPYFINTQPLGYDYAILGAPRTYGLTVKYNF